jgi:6-phosphofructo-2-kinase/fructose-2,6-biphosphatase 4
VRLEPCIFELERVREDLLIIGHASVIRCLVGTKSCEGWKLD